MNVQQLKAKQELERCKKDFNSICKKKRHLIEDLKQSGAIGVTGRRYANRIRACDRDKQQLRDVMRGLARQVVGLPTDKATMETYQEVLNT